MSRAMQEGKVGNRTFSFFVNLMIGNAYNNMGGDVYGYFG